jgi:hypothetical protein
MSTRVPEGVLIEVKCVYRAALGQGTMDIVNMVRTALISLFEAGEHRLDAKLKGGDGLGVESAVNSYWLWEDTLGVVVQLLE